jgi:cyclic beta-1,2-glucan synthetase
MLLSFMGMLSGRSRSAKQDACADDVPIRHEVFAEDRLREHAASLAASHEVVRRGVSHHVVLGRVRNNHRLMREAYSELMTASESGGTITPAAEWLVDNFYTAELHIHQIIEDLPSAYFRQLPKLAKGHLAGYPRVMAIAWAYLAHTDSHFDQATLAEFTMAYQEVSQLAVGELWALAIHLRILLIENATRIACRTVVSRRAREAADAMAQKVSVGHVSAFEVRTSVAGLADHARLSFAVQLISRLRVQPNVSAEAIADLQDVLRSLGHSPETAAHEEHARQISNNLSMQNVFTSLKRIAEQDWEAWFERVSDVDRILAQSEVYRGLDDASRSSYRNAVEDLARHSDRGERDIARLAFANGSRGDPGEALIGATRGAFQRQIGYRTPLSRRVREALRGQGAAGYVASIALLSLVIVVIGSKVISTGKLGAPTSVLLLLLLAVPAFDAALAMINFALTQLMRPMVLPGLSFECGIPEDCRTVVAVPVMLSSTQVITEMINRIEDHYLANDDPELFYALVSDWKDADQERTEGDDGLLAAAAAAVRELNERHGHSRFLLMHRGRRWNARQAVWMGWERKRGKLHELNLILRGSTDTSFIQAPDPVPSGVKYVIVLDADTLLPRGAARRLIGKMAHPQCRPAFDAATGRVVSGYGILQPRVTIALPKLGRGSLFQQIFTSRPGIDPYVFATSDVYQDLFGEGMFTGKGIYDVDAFTAALRDRIPDNTLLSHDLLEGNFARAGLVSDVQVVEEFPEQYLVDAARHHRWARGDWQLLPWMFPPAKGLTGLGLWKMVDNLRRTLTSPMTLAAFLVGWIVLPGANSAAWTLFVGALVFIPALLPIFAGSSLRREPSTLESQILTLRDDVLSALALTAARLILLAHQSWVMLDAVGRTLFRLLISRRKLLEWTASAQLQSRPNASLGATHVAMASSVAIGGLALVGLILPFGELSAAALPLSLAWCLAPTFAFLISRTPLDRTEQNITPDVRLALRKVAMRTWRFFDEHVASVGNALPPDNFQEDPIPKVAHRTSPTNIGLYLLSTVSACEMGWIGTEEAVNRIAASLATMKRLDLYRGHLFNWYDTQTLAPLEPRYVSTVDSGNLATHLIAVANAMEEWRRSGKSPEKRLEGLGDMFAVLHEVLARNGGTARVASEAAGQFRSFMRGINAKRPTSEDLRGAIERIQLQVEWISRIIGHAKPVSDATSLDDAHYWVSFIARSVAELERNLTENVGSDVHSSVLLDVARQCRVMAYGMDFGFLLDRQRHLLSIGYRMEDETLDQSCYDLLASEASLTSFLAIAKADVAEGHWLRLGRPVTAVRNAACLVSWSGSMFEYLMPLLVLQNRDGTLVNQTHRLVVDRQIAYGKARGTPWGISESAYAVRDLGFTYQYSNFGVPGLGLKRGLADSHVIAPYATALAAMVAPTASAENYGHLQGIGGEGRLGFYEALDFTASRLRAGQSHEVIRAYFAHHQGMTITAIHNAVSGGALRSHFHRENVVRSAELLLQERAPSHLPARTIVTSRPVEMVAAPSGSGEESRHVVPHEQVGPATHLLSNGNYAVMLTARATGYSRWKGIAINRWRRDPIADESGLAIYLRDLETNTIWPAAPSLTVSGTFEGTATFGQEKAEYHRTDLGITTHLECVISTEDDSEARCLQLVNTSDIARRVEYTTYMELALAMPEADDAHPAFSKLFVETEFLPELQALIAHRRKRLDSDPEIWVAQFIVSDNKSATAIQYETARQTFLGRGRTVNQAMTASSRDQLRSTTGTVIDPIFAMRQSVRLKPHQRSRSVIWTLAADSRDALLEKVSRHRTMAVFERVQVLAWTQSRILLRHLSIDASEANLFQRLAASLVYSTPRFRPAPAAIARGMQAQATLWPLGISGNRPIVALTIKELEDIGLVRQILRAQDYWQEKGLAVDVVIINERRTSYLQELQKDLDDLVGKERVSRSRQGSQDAGDIFALRSDLLHPGIEDAIMSAAHVVFHAAHGTLAQQMRRTRQSQTLPPRVTPPAPLAPAVGQESGAELQFYNGFGGFDPITSEYVIRHRPAEALPAPWINVIANPHFGTHCSAEGGGYSWYQNSREFQITSYSNDAVSDVPSEVFYVRDAATGTLSSPTVLPLGRRTGSFQTRHGFGHTIYSATEHALNMTLTHTVDTADPVKRSRLGLVNDRPVDSTLTVTFYADVLLGHRRATAAHFVTTELDETSQALFLRNRWRGAGGNTVVFADLQGAQTNWTGNRLAVLGELGGIDAPQGLLTAVPLAREVGGGFDPCVALQVEVTLGPGERKEVVLTLGAASTDEMARQLVTKYRELPFESTLDTQKTFWGGVVGKVQVKSPDPAFDIMMNGWLLYQTISCRMWARAGFYQASGAYGFRDQLQDSMALAHVLPDLARNHLLLAASRQFELGDVQHWWLPETGAGVRTRISDDTAWLVHCTAHYVKLTGDRSILDESVPFLSGRALEKDEHDAFYIPDVSSKAATLYEHCALALSYSYRLGSHGLPLMGTGDWNDGMNRVGEGGKGESIWLGWFLCRTLASFAEIAAWRRDGRRAAKFLRWRDALAVALDQSGWDGSWFRRAYFDDGTPLGTAAAGECRIDTIAQSWAALSGVANVDKARQAMASVENSLLDWDDRIACLFWPPFSHHSPNPGYIQSYPPGVRENGGQYSHGAIWGIYAFSELRETELAAKLFDLINPINHALTAEDARRYKVEPYVIAADIYSVAPHRGRGGWTWYTGAAGWGYRAGLEAILGLRRAGAILLIKPCIPASWNAVEVGYRYKGKAITLVFTRQGRTDPEVTQIPAKPGEHELNLENIEDGRRYEIVLN